MEIHVNQIKLNGKDKWTVQFNLCSDLFQKANSESLPESDRDIYLKQWQDERIKLETGNY